MNSPFVRWLLDVDSIPASADDLRLAWEQPWPGWLWMLLIIAVAAFAFWSYGRQIGPRPARVTLAVARTLLLALVLVLVSGPLLEHPRETVEQDWVLVMTDRSRSMTIADASAPGSEPGSGSGAGRETRDRQMRRILDDHADMWNRLAEDRHVVWLGFHAGAFNLDVSPHPAPDPGTGDPAAAPVLGPVVDLGDPVGQRTQLSTSIEQAMRQAAARPLSAVVIFSDGRTTEPPDRRVVRWLQQEAVPVFPVALGSPDPIGDVAIRKVEAPRRAFVRDKVPVVVELERLGGNGGQDLTVKLVDTVTGELLDRLEMPAGDDRERVTLTAQPSLQGEATWQVVIETTRPDLIPDNNLKPFLIDLVDRPLRVLFVEGYPRWEYRYVKNLLIREESIESSIFLRSAARDFAQEGNLPIARLPRSPEEFAQFDVIILGDIVGSFFPAEQLDMIRDQVATRGAGLLWMAGERATPVSYAGTVLADLLPMRGSLNLPAVGRVVHMQPTPLAERLGVLQIAAYGQVGWPQELQNPSNSWSGLYYTQRIEPGRLKPTAEVLAQTTEMIDGTPLPLVAHMRFGAGQTIYVATDEIWRWRYGQGELMPEQFWIQMIRMLGRDTLITGGEQALLDVLPRRVAVNQPVQIDLRLLDAQLAAARRASVIAVVEDEAGVPRAELELRRFSEEEERYTATYLPNTPGNLRVAVRDPALPEITLEATFEVYTAEDELRRPETDHGLLADLAAATGGRVLTPVELPALENELPNRSVRTINPLTERIWDTPLFFVLIVTIITLEWIGRKMIRLV